LSETARYLALWMSYEDTIRVADLKTRRSRFQRVREEVRLQPDQIVGIKEFLHPRVEEIADTLPASLGAWLLRTPWACSLAGRFTRKGRVVHTNSIRGFLLLYGIAALRPLRRASRAIGKSINALPPGWPVFVTLPSRTMTLRWRWPSVSDW
jgi:indolepyruvate ferredoxin oxidoreductase, beta subunit